VPKLKVENMPCYLSELRVITNQNDVAQFSNWSNACNFIVQKRLSSLQEFSRELARLPCLSVIKFFPKNETGFIKAGNHSTSFAVNSSECRRSAGYFWLSDNQAGFSILSCGMNRGYAVSEPEEQQP
jgi:hypothetical protein